MEPLRADHRHTLMKWLIFLVIGLLGFGLQGCQLENPGMETVSPPIASKVEPVSQPDLPSEKTPSSQDDSAPTSLRADFPYATRESYLPPSIDPATPIPPPLVELDLDEEILVWVLLGADVEPPYTGRTEAIHLLFIHPRFSKASLVSIPGDLYVYIPGYTMQRLNTAYALGGIETLRDTFAYNFGVRPSRFVLAHPGDFQWLVDDINSVDVTVFYPIPQYCGGIPAGLIRMDGSLALCYASFRDKFDEIDRMRRQQQLMRVIFRKITQDGNLIQLPTLYASYEGWIKTDLSMSELLSYIPLALRLADTDRVSYSMLGWEVLTLWEIPGYSQAQVFLPDREGVLDILQQAINFVLTPAPLTNQVQTLEAQLTAVHQSTAQFIATPTPSQTPTPATTFAVQTATPTPTQTLQGYP